MKIQLILPLIGLLLIGGCSKSSRELFELSEENLKNNQIDQAIDDLEKLLNKYPQDSLASQAQYKLASIHLNWKNDLTAGYAALQNTVTKYENSIPVSSCTIFAILLIIFFWCRNSDIELTNGTITSGNGDSFS